MLDEFPNRERASVGRNPDQARASGGGTTHEKRLAAIRHLTQELTAHVGYLRELAPRYNWWQTPDVALQFPARLVAQVMNLGTFADINQLARTLGEDCLRRILENAEAGQLSPRSWHYWHYRLHHVKPGQIPPMPQRRIA